MVSATKSRFSAAPVLNRLKDFQKRTVDYAFQSMFLDPQPSRRFLVADEVGLGKTLVARGVIAKTLEHVLGKTGRVDIIYICSNADIATQNIARLNVIGKHAFVEATRLTLLPLKVRELRERDINFISFTPGTTFDHGRRTGRMEERRLIYQMLKGRLEINKRGLARLLKGNLQTSNWRKRLNESQVFDTSIAEDFRKVLAKDVITEKLRVLADGMSGRTATPAQKQEALELTGKLRAILARCCLAALNPELVILDEFQRFRDLLADPDDPNSNPSAELAHQLFNHSNDLRVLLLSATPYKMYAAHHEEENHHQDFLKTARFLLDDTSKVDTLKAELRDFRNALMDVTNLDAALERPVQAKSRIEGILKRVMCRTERVGTTMSLDAMVQERRETVPVTAEDILDFRCIDQMSKAIDAPHPLEYWRSSPYLLNFMKEGTYELKHRLVDRKYNTTAAHVFETCGGYRLLQRNDIGRYQPLDAANARLRTLVSDIDRNQSWRLLWVPPSLPYWAGEGAYKDADGFTKTLVFSSWNVVPDAIASLLSYHVELKSVAGLARRPRYEQLTKRLKPRLRFPGKSDGSFPGMNALTLMYPSEVLANLVEPFGVFVESHGSASLANVRALVRDRVAKALQSVSLPALDKFAPHDRRWYWIALVLMERQFHPGMREWCQAHWNILPSEDGAELDDDVESRSGFQRHVKQWLTAWDNADLKLGRVPEDLVDVLADIALAGPAVCAYRSLRRIVGPTRASLNACRSAAVRIADGLRRQFNAPEAIATLQQDDDDDAYWQRVLHYSAEGNLQSLLDEYVHLENEDKTSSETDSNKVAEEVAASIFNAASIRTSQLHPDYPSISEGQFQMNPQPLSLRCRYALRYGNAKEEDGAVARKEIVRAAFNSPFRPFVLASTSVGQEGLDFHSWCHAVVHWNIPNNPVDLEQREGRVNRYKGHAVRRNVAKIGHRELTVEATDPWMQMFESARRRRVRGASDLIPYWICEIPGGAKVERRVFDLPMSKDASRLRQMKSSLALYRMVFGQPRQDDLIEHLLRNFPDHSHASKLMEQWRIDLEPPHL